MTLGNIAAGAWPILALVAAIVLRLLASRMARDFDGWGQIRDSSRDAAVMLEAGATFLLVAGAIGFALLFSRR